MLSIDSNSIYVAARRVLLDASAVLGPHRDALVLVGAQAVYLRAGDADLKAFAPFTTDADFSIDPDRLGPEPEIAEAMLAAGFVLKQKAGGNGIEPGAWLSETVIGGEKIWVEVDLMVPEALAPGHGKRDARLSDHAKNAARWTPGLELSIFDNSELRIASLEPQRDPRITTMRVAGEAALLVAKAHKIGERVRAAKDARVKPKDAGDVFRLMRAATPPAEVGRQLAEYRRNPVCRASIDTGVDHLRLLFGGPRSRGVELAVDALDQVVAPDEIRAAMPAYLAALLTAYR